MSKRVIIALIAVLGLAVSVAQATPSRIETLGEQTGLVYLQDDTDVFYNPATVGYYRNVLLLHLGAQDGGDMYALGGVSLGIGDMLTLAVIAGRNPNYEVGFSSLSGNESASIGWIMVNSLDLTSAGPTPWNFLDNSVFYNVGTNTVSLAGLNDAAMDWMNPIDVMLAAKLGSINLGVSYYIANGKHLETYEDDAPTDTTIELKALLQAVKVGLSADLGNMMPELWFAYVPFKVTGSYEDDVANTSLDRELRGRRINVGGRLFYKANDNLTIVPAVEWTSIGGEMTIDSDPIINPVSVVGFELADFVESFKGNLVRAGIGINYSVDKILVASSIGMEYAKISDTLEVDGLDGDVEYSWRWLELPKVGLGIEYQATNILVLRTGINTTTIYASQNNEVTSDVLGSGNFDDNARESYQLTKAATGIGLHFGNLIVDLTAGELLVDAENDTTGNSSFFSAMDVKYKF